MDKMTHPVQSPKRHCMVVFAPYPLGETRVQREAEALVKHGYEVDVVCIPMPGEPPIDEYKGIKIYREEYRLPIVLLKGSVLGGKFLKYIRFLLSATIRVTRLHFKKRYGTIQVHNLPDFLVFCTLIPRLMGVPIILDLHDLMPEFFAGRYGLTSSSGVQLIHLQERLSCRFADHVITVSEHWRQALIGRGVPADKCSVVMNVADDQIFHSSRNNHTLGTSRDGFRLIYHGSIHQRYGLDLAVQAVDRVRQEIPGIHLLLVGKGEYLPSLQAMIDKLQLQDYITIKPLHLAEELPDIILSCDLGIVPYRNDIFTDSLLPTKLMEYAALGMPAIASRTSAIQAYFSDTNAEFFEPGNVDDLARCITNLYHNPEFMTALARGSQNFNQRYNWAKISKDYVSLVDRLRMNGSTNAS